MSPTTHAFRHCLVRSRTSRRRRRRPDDPSSSRQMAPFWLVDSSLFGVPEETLWLLRIGSAIFSYVGFVAYFDSPRGQLRLDLHHDIEIQQSSVPGAGLGLYAKTFLPKGTVLGTYPGTVIPLKQNLSKLSAFPRCEAYVWRFSDNRFVIDPTNEQGVLDATCAGGNPSMPGSVHLFGSVFRPLFTVSTALCRINEPPRGMDVNVVTREDMQDRSVLFELERDVVAGEEFFLDYGRSYDRSMYSRDSD
jgi:hypothetical protein